MFLCLYEQVSERETFCMVVLDDLLFLEAKKKEPTIQLNLKTL